MKAVMSLLLGLAMVLAFSLTGTAEEKKEAKKVTLKGTVTCAKCDLKETDACLTVVKVKEKDKEVIYYFDSASSKKFHKEICREAKKGTVTGTVTEKEGKKIIAATEVKFE